MCGLAGVISNCSSLEREHILAHMLRTTSHRGPDHTCIQTFRNISYGMNRLSINDLRNGFQPFSSNDNTVTATINGEVYNYPELKEHLLALGVHVRTNSDCEVIPHLYQIYGINFVSLLRGMYAISLIDKTIDRLFLVRDRMGEKPIYYTLKNDSFIYCSEFKGLVASGSVDIILDPLAINDYFYYQYVPEPSTILQDVFKVPKGSYLAFDLNSTTFTIDTYWDHYNLPPRQSDNIADEIAFILRSAVSEQLLADVPVSIALSGGIDSSAIACLARQATTMPITAFSVGYPGPSSSDERGQALELAKKLDIDFVDVEISNSELTNTFLDMCYARDEPIADISGTGYYAIALACKQHGFPVLLQGQGSDELFFGYQWVQEAGRQAIHSSNRRDIKLFNRLSRHLPKKHDPTYTPFHEYAPDWQSATKNLEQLYTQSAKLIVSPSNPNRHYALRPPSIDGPSSIADHICNTYLLSNGITQGDRLSMYHSVELRLPFTDHRLIEVVQGFRRANPTLHDVLMEPKSLLKTALTGIVPDAILNRPKLGFNPPVHEWHKSLFATYGSIITNGYLRSNDILTPTACQHLSKGSRFKGEVTPIAFKTLVLEAWILKMKQLKSSIQTPY